MLDINVKIIEQKKSIKPPGLSCNCNFFISIFKNFGRAVPSSTTKASNPFKVCQCRGNFGTCPESKIFIGLRFMSAQSLKRVWIVISRLKEFQGGK